MQASFVGAVPDYVSMQLTIKDQNGDTVDFKVKPTTKITKVFIRVNALEQGPLMSVIVTARGRAYL